MLETTIDLWIERSRRRSGSHKTETAYRGTLHSFRAALHAGGLDLDSEPQWVAPVAEQWAGERAPGSRRSGAVSAATFNQRLAILSSFYRFCIRRGLAGIQANPIDQLERRPAQRYGKAQALKPAEVRTALQAIDRDTLKGKRDYALLSVGIATGRRASELAALTWGCISTSGGTVTLHFERTKGDKSIRDTLSPAVGRALLDYLNVVYAGNLMVLPNDAPVWVALGGRQRGRALTYLGISGIVEKYLGTSKVHVLRHTFAHGMDASGAKLTETQRRLGHGSPATTGHYLEALRSDENPYAATLDALFGIE
jgi:integrase